MKTKTALLLTLLVLMLLIGAALPAAAQGGPTYSISVYSTAQRFEGGLMLWRSDTAYIWVLLNDGTVQRFPSWRYSRLPDNNIVPPSGRIVPLFGFGKIWANYGGLRQQLGFPIQPELGFNMGIHSANGVFFLTQLDGTVYEIHQNGHWNYGALPPPPNPNPNPNSQVNFTATYAAFQQFENGFMIWRADTGTVYTFTNWGGSGQYGAYGQEAYQYLPDNPYRDAPPNRFAPINGFGRVWGGNDYLRRQLGWAVSGEQGYDLTLGDIGGVLNNLTVPNGQVIQLDMSNGSWHF